VVIGARQPVEGHESAVGLGNPARTNVKSYWPLPRGLVGSASVDWGSAIARLAAVVRDARRAKSTACRCRSLDGVDMFEDSDLRFKCVFRFPESASGVHS